MLRKRICHAAVSLLLSVGLIAWSGNVVVEAEGDYQEPVAECREDTITVPALGADISQVQDLENTEPEENAGETAAGTSDVGATGEQSTEGASDTASTEEQGAAGTLAEGYTEEQSVAGTSNAESIEEQSAGGVSDTASMEEQNTEGTSNAASAAAQSSAETVAKARAAAALPEKYDSRDYGFVTSVKDQGEDSQLCWAYSVIGTAETDMIAGGKSISGTLSKLLNTDFSEEHMAYYFYHMPADPMGNTDGDATTALGDWLWIGGNHVFTTFALADWYGLADESTASAADWENDSPLLSDYPDSVHMQKAYWINLATDVSNVKKMIEQYGSVAVSMYYTGNYYNSATFAYYSNRYIGVNHAVQIIGWDDTYSRDNFLDGNKPSADGAWLVKNSYGTSFGDEGYFWISYEDAAFTTETAKAFVFDFESADNYDNIYQYDGSAGAYMDSKAKDTGYRVASGASIANVFTVPTDNETGYQKLSAVSFALYAVQVDYSIQIYKNPSPSDPASGTPLLTEPKTGTTSFVGYYTIPLETELLLSNGDTFSVVVTLSKSSGGNISYFVDKTYPNGGWISFTNVTEAGESFAYQNGAWTDLSSSGATARIKAFTENYQITASSLTIDSDAATLWKGDAKQLALQILPENASYRTASWSSSDDGVALVDENGLVTAVGVGTAVVTAEAKDGSGLKDEITITVKQQAQRVTAGIAKLTCLLNQTASLELTLYPENAAADSIYFISSDTNVVSVDGQGTITGKGIGAAVIEVYSAYNDDLLFSSEIEVQPASFASAAADASQIQMVETTAVQDATAVKAPETADKNQPGIWFALMGIGAAGTIFYGRKFLRR